MSNFKIQVDKDHYKKEYNSVPKFISYFYQIDITEQLKPKRILEIGVGNGIVSNYFKTNYNNIDTCDFEKKLNPDFCADIRNMPIKSSQYDLVMACEVLEHMPYSDFEKALSEIKRVSKKYVLVSIPYCALSFEMTIKIPGLRKIINRRFLDFFFRFPMFFKKPKFNGEHYWEIGTRGYSLKKVRKDIEKHFNIKKEIRPIMNSYDHFFLLEKK